MPLSKAESIRVDGLNSRESRKLIIKIAAEQKWSWRYDASDNLVIDVADSFKEDSDDADKDG